MAEIPLSESHSVPSPKKERKTFAIAPIRRLMKNEGALLISADAITLLITKLEIRAYEIAKEAVKLVHQDKRKRVNASDILEATKIIKN